LTFTKVHIIYSKVGKWVPLKCTLGVIWCHCNDRCVKFEFREYYIVVYEKQFWIKTVCQPMLLSTFYDMTVVRIIYFTNTMVEFIFAEKITFENVLCI